MKTGMLLILLLALVAPVSAAGVGHTHGNDHMAGMRAAKEKIPAEFRVMDRTPVTPSAASLAQGKNLFSQNCAVCHGPKGMGDGPAAASMATLPANFHDAHHSGFYNPGEKFWIISHGLDTGMPAFAPHLTPQQRWDLVNYLLQLPQESMDELFR